MIISAVVTVGLIVTIGVLIATIVAITVAMIISTASAGVILVSAAVLFARTRTVAMTVGRPLLLGLVYLELVKSAVPHVCSVILAEGGTEGGKIFVGRGRWGRWW
jgi:hypothetical protein